VLISLEGVKEALSVNAQWVDELFLRALGKNVSDSTAHSLTLSQDSDFEFVDFMEFLETGKLVDLCLSSP
jgi:hypothetical protein